jgi:hypothetical protein
MNGRSHEMSAATAAKTRLADVAATGKAQEAMRSTELHRAVVIARGLTPLPPVDPQPAALVMTIG